MRTAMIAAVAAIGLFGVQSPVMPTIGNMLVPEAHADAVQRYEGGVALQHTTSPERVRPYAQGEGARGGETAYGRQLAQAEGPSGGHTDYGRQVAQAEDPRGGQTYYGRRFAAGEQTGVDNGAYRQTV